MNCWRQTLPHRRAPCQSDTAIGRRAVTLLEDLTGQGHITRTHGEDGMLSIFLPLDEGTTVE